MKGMKKLFALFAVLALALTLTPVLTANAQVTPVEPEQKLVVTEVKWGTEASFELGTATTPVVQVKGKITGVTDLNTASLNIYKPNVTTAPSSGGLARAGSTLNLQTGDFTLYVDFSSLLSYGDGAYKVWYLTSATKGIVDDAPITLGVFTTKEAVPSEVTSGQKVRITGTGTLRDGSAFPTGYGAYEIVIWKNENGTPTITATAPLNIASPGTSTTATFDLSFNACGPVGTEYYFTVQDADTDQVYHGATYFTVKVTKEAELTVKPSPSTIMAGATTNVEFAFTANGVKLENNAVTVTITLGNDKTVTTATTSGDGKLTIPVYFANPGVATVEAKATGPVYGKGNAVVAVQRAVPQEAIDVEFPTWVVGQYNTITLKTPLDGYTIDELKVKISGPVEEDGETKTVTSAPSYFNVIPVGYGVITLEVTGTITNGTPLKVSKTFTDTIPGYVATVDPEELVRGATQTLTVVVKDAYGNPVNPVNNALVQLFSSKNDASNAIAELNGSATTVVNNGTYKLTILAAKVANADDEAYVLVKGTDGKVKAYAGITILPSEDVKITLEKTEIVLGPKTTLTVTVASPVSLQGAKISLIDPKEKVDSAISWMFTDTATVQKVTLTIDEMPKFGAGVYTIVVEPVDQNHVGSATVAFVDPKFSASPSELVAGSTVVVTVTSANVSDLKSVVDIKGEGVTVKSFATSTEAITATLVAGSDKGTATLTFKFDSGYDKATLNLTVVYGKLTVESATVAFGTKVLTFKPVDAAGATLAAGTEVKINLLGNEYNGSVAADGSVSILIPELPMGTYSVLVKVAGYQDATFSLVVAEAEPEYKTVIELAPGMDIYTVNGETKFWDATPYIKEGRTLVPIRHLAEAVGFKADWDFSDPANKMVFIFKADQDPEKDKEHPFILLIIGQPTAMVSGNLVALDVAPEILNGRTMVPLRFVVETLGYKVEWLGGTIRLYK